MNKLNITNLRKTYGDFVAVEGLNLSIEEGETVALLGPSGCGKSTTLNMIVGLTEPTGGDIKIDGRSVTDAAPGSRGIGLVFQDYAVFGNMTVRQNLAFGLQVRKYNKERIKIEVEKTAKLLNLTESLDDSTSEMGGSQLQRVALGRTLVTNPSILLLDEPLSNLEAAMRNEMRQELRRIQKQTGQTVIYVTHDQVEALSLAHKIAIMENGRLVQYGNTYDVYHYPEEKFVGGFLGNPPMNFLDGVLVADGGKMKLQIGETEIDLPKNLLPENIEAGEMICLGIRPESIDLVAAKEGIACEITLVEQLGADCVLTAILGDQEIRILQGGESDIAVGSICGLQLHSKMISLFDAKTGKRLQKANKTQGDRK